MELTFLDFLQTLKIADAGIWSKNGLLEKHSRSDNIGGEKWTVNKQGS